MCPRFAVIALCLILGRAQSGRAETWKFVVSGDCRSAKATETNGVNTAILGEIAAAVVREGAELVLVPGDLCFGKGNQAALESQLTTFRDTMGPVYKAGIAVYATWGNHEVSSVDARAAWNRVFRGPYAMPSNGPPGERGTTFSVVHKNALIIALDNYANGHRVNQAWLDKQLACRGKTHVFVFGHEPAFKAHHTDNLDDCPAHRDAFWKSLTAGGCRVYFAGHDHLYNHARIDDGDGDPGNDLHQIIVGTAGAPFHATYAYDGDNGPYKPVGVFGESQYGYVLVEVEGGHVTMTWKRRTAPGVYAAGGDVFRYTVAAEPKRHATGDVMPAATAPAATPAGNRRSLQRARN